MKGVIYTLLLVLSYVGVAPLWADDAAVSDTAGEEDMFFASIPSVFSASKHEQEVTQAPASVSVVTAEEIELYGYRTILEILASMTGIFQTNDRNYGYVGIRGFTRPGDYNSRLLILVNGQRVDDAVYMSSSVLHDFPFDIDLIERVEMIRGPASALYGSSAVIGLVNVITKRGRDIGGAEASVEYASFDTFKLRATYGTRLPSGFEFMLSATAYESEGDKHLYYPEYDDPSTNNGVYENNDGDQSRQLMVSAGYGGFRFSLNVASREKEIPTASYETVFNDSRTQTTDDYLMLGLQYTKRLADRFEVTGRLGFVDFHEEGDYPYEWPPVVMNHDFIRGEATDAEIQLAFDAGQQNKVLFGASFRNSNRLDLKNFDEVDDYDGINLDSRNTEHNWGVFLQDEISFGSRFRAIIGLRYDKFQSFGDNLSPRIALIHNPTEKSTLKLLYGEAFRAPNGYERYYNDGEFSWKEPGELDAESMENFEFVLEHKINENLRGVVSYYHYHLKDVLTLVTDPLDDLLVMKNESATEVNGVDLEIEGQWPSGIDGSISYSHNDGHNEGPRSDLFSAPSNMAKLHLGYPILAEKLIAGLDLQYMGRRNLLDGGHSKSSIVANLSVLSRQLSGSLKISATVYNLFDDTVEHPGGEEHLQGVIVQDGRSFRIKLSGNF